MDIKGAFRKIKNNVYNYDDAERRIREATNNNEEQKPTDEQLNEIANDTRNAELYQTMFRMLWKRLHDYQHMQHVLKGLMVTEYCILHGHQRFRNDMTNERRIEIVRRLRGYKFLHDNKEIAGEVRVRAKRVVDLLENKEKMAEALEKAKHTRQAISGPAPGAKEHPETVEGEPDPPVQAAAKPDPPVQAAPVVEEKAVDDDPFGAFDDFGFSAPAKPAVQPGAAAQNAQADSFAPSGATNGQVRSQQATDDWLSDFSSFATPQPAAAANPAPAPAPEAKNNQLLWEDPFAPAPAQKPIVKPNSMAAMAQKKQATGGGMMGMQPAKQHVPNKDPFGDMAMKKNVFGTPQNNPFGTFGAPQQPNQFGPPAGGYGGGFAGFAAPQAQANPFMQQGFGAQPAARAAPQQPAWGFQQPQPAGFNQGFGGQTAGGFGAPAQPQANPFANAGFGIQPAVAPKKESDPFAGLAPSLMKVL